MTRSILSFFAVALLGLNLNACAAIMQDMARSESAGYLGCPSRDIRIEELDAWGRSYRATCHGHAMVCSATGDQEHRQVHCADADPGER